MVSVLDGEGSLVSSVCKDQGTVSAVDLVRAGVAERDAKGGGPDGKRADAALTAIERHLAGHAAAAE